MTRVAHKKSIERELFLRARRHVSLWPLGAIDDGGEAPDLLISGPYSSYGVEVTEIVRTQEKAMLEARRIICALAKSKYVLQGGRDGLQVTGIFDEAVALSKRSYESIADELVEIVVSEVPNGSTGAVRLRLERGSAFQSTYFTTVWLHETPMIARSDWRTANAFWTPVLHIPEIQAELARKEAHLKRYRRRVMQVWLLLVADGFDGSTSWSVENAAYGAIYKSNFDGVVLYEQAADRATTLQIVGTA
jgi:hypothetical protein